MGQKHTATRHTAVGRQRVLRRVDQSAARVSAAKIYGVGIDHREGRDASGRPEVMPPLN